MRSTFRSARLLVAVLLNEKRYVVKINFLRLIPLTILALLVTIPILMPTRIFAEEVSSEKINELVKQHQALSNFCADNMHLDWSPVLITFKGHHLSIPINYFDIAHRLPWEKELPNVLT